MRAAELTDYPVEIGAPDGAAALDLEHRLWHLGPISIERGRRWYVEVPAVDDADEIIPIVRHWLRDVGEPTTTMQVDGRQPVVVTRAGRARAAVGFSGERFSKRPDGV